MKQLDDMTNILDNSGLFNLYISLLIVDNSYVEECKMEKQIEVLKRKKYPMKSLILPLTYQYVQLNI